MRDRVLREFNAPVRAGVTEAIVDGTLTHLHANCVCVPPRSVVWSALEVALAIADAAKGEQ